MPEVNCSVANCKFWKQGNTCNAESILIEIDAHQNNDYDVEAGSLAEEYRDKDYAHSIAETCCHTFRPKGK
jgi:hypothetical protein